MSNYADRVVSNLDSLREGGNLPLTEALDTNANILGAKGIYDPEPIVQVPYENYNNLVKLPTANAVIDLKPDLLVVIPKDAPVGTQWTLKFSDETGRESTTVGWGIMSYIVQEPSTFDPTAANPAFNGVGIVNGDLSTAVHLVKTGVDTADLVYL